VSVSCVITTMSARATIGVSAAGSRPAPPPRRTSYSVHSSETSRGGEVKTATLEVRDARSTMAQFSKTGPRAVAMNALGLAPALSRWPGSAKTLWRNRNPAIAFFTDFLPKRTDALTGFRRDPAGLRRTTPVVRSGVCLEPGRHRLAGLGCGPHPRHRQQVAVWLRILTRGRVRTWRQSLDMSPLERCLYCRPRRSGFDPYLPHAGSDCSRRERSRGHEYDTPPRSLVRRHRQRAR